MPEPRTEDRRAAANTGFFGHLSGFTAGFLEYVRVRLTLAGIEAKEAGIHFGILVGLLIAAVVMVFIGYLFLCLAAVFAIAALLPGPHTWIWLTFAVALLHFGVAIAAVLIVRARIATPVFSATLDEFKKDQEWLNTTTTKKL